MAEKRYAIVRIDKKDCGNCEFAYKDKNGKVACKIGGIWQCDNYGDTKEQLIRKVATAILRTLKDGEVLKYEEFGTGFIKQPVSVEYLAKSIIEFLGVE